MGDARRLALIWRVAAWALPLWVVVAVWGWNAAGNNPREGWSLVKTTLGVVGPSPSGDRAYITGTGRWVRADLSAFGLPADADLWVLVRRNRVGGFVPWLETTDLRLMLWNSEGRDLRTGTVNPAWPDILSLARPGYATGDTEWHQRVVAGIDAEMRGELPRRRVLIGALLGEALVLTAHVWLVVACFGLGLRSWQKWMGERRAASGVAWVGSLKGEG